MWELAKGKIEKSEEELGKPVRGKKFCRCKSCGKDFAQDLVERETYFAYTNYKTCLDCRHAARVKRPDEQESRDIQEYNVTLDYTPHAGQALFHESKARFRVIDAGARFGKDRATTMEGVRYFLRCLSENRSTDMVPSVNWWIIAPSERIAQQNWRELKKYFPRGLVVDLSNANMQLQTKFGGVISVRSAYDEESLVAEGLDLVTITEAARIPELGTVWSNVEARLNSPGRGLGGKGGIGIINSSPLGRNYFYKMFLWGQQDSEDADPDWESWKFPTWANPAMAVKFDEVRVNKRGEALSYRDRLLRRMGYHRFMQDYGAEFLGNNEKCFRDFDANCVCRVPAGLDDAQRKAYALRWKSPQPGESYLVSYDPAGGQNDIPAVLVGCVQTGAVKRVVDLSGKGWNQQYDALAEISAQYCFAPVAFSKTGHETIGEELVKRGLQVITFDEQGKNKENFIIHLQGQVECGGVQVLDDGGQEVATLIRQMRDYERVQKGNTVTYKNVEEPHDDFVSALYILAEAMKPAALGKAEAPAAGMLGGIRHGGRKR